MANIRVFNPWSMLPSVWEDASDMFGGPSGVSPKTNMYEKDNIIHVELEAPGYKTEDLEISITGDVLTITGKSKEEKEEKQGRRYFVSEISEKSFIRTLSMPSEVKAENVVAEFKDGVLKLTLPKSEKALPKTIKIEPK